MLVPLIVICSTQTPSLAEQPPQAVDIVVDHLTGANVGVHLEIA
jgi:hypothetical protein